MRLSERDKPTIYNVAMTTGSTEYSQALPARVKRFVFQLRGSNDCLLCYTVGLSGTTYLTVKSGSSYSEDTLNPYGTITLYFQSAAASQVAEIVAWE